jgi:hypothetical protein
MAFLNGILSEYRALKLSREKECKGKLEAERHASRELMEGRQIAASNLRILIDRVFQPLVEALGSEAEATLHAENRDADYDGVSYSYLSSIRFNVHRKGTPYFTDRLGRLFVTWHDDKYVLSGDLKVEPGNTASLFREEKSALIIAEVDKFAETVVRAVLISD